MPAVEGKSPIPIPALWASQLCPLAGVLGSVTHHLQQSNDTTAAVDH